MRAFVTGATGFAGSHLVEHLLSTGDEVIGCARSISPSAQLQGATLWPCDVGRADSLRTRHHELAAFAPDVIYHLAAISIPADCGAMHPTPIAREINVEGTRHVLDLAAELPRPPRVVIVSSSHVYAPVSADTPRVDEHAPLGARNGYAATKRQQESLAHEAVERTGLDVVIVRPFQHAGPRQNPRLMLSSWAKVLAQGRPRTLEVHTLDAWLDLSDVRDVVRAYRLLAERGTRGETYNVGSGVASRSGDLLELLERAADHWPRIVEIYPVRKQEPIAEIGRLQEATGWEPRIPLEQTVRDTLDYWRHAGRRTVSPRD